MEQDPGSLGKSEIDSIARLCDLKLEGPNDGVGKLIYGRRQDGSPILDFCHLQTVYTNICGPETLLATQELLNGTSKIVSLSLECGQSAISMAIVILNFLFHSQ